MVEPLVRLRSVERIHQLSGRPVVALANATCEVYPGDRIAVTGPSGSGKSTLLHLMAGLDTPTGGEVTWPALHSSTKLRPRYIAMSFQTASLLPALTIAENIDLPLLLDGGAAGDVGTAALLERFGIGDIADRLPEEVSGGQLHRAAVARALVTRPQLVLADEPTGQLDSATAQRFLDQILAAVEETGEALVIATHDPAVARRMKSIWRMSFGKLAINFPLREAS
jgi:ABC-type lipoprotein export system ATPase subunit